MIKTIQRDGMELVTASAFYKNDKAGGVGIHFPKPGKDFVRRVDELLSVWNTYATPQTMHAQLREFGDYLEKYGDLSEIATLTAFVNIVWLESRGHLVPDNFNGGYWQWRTIA